MSNCDFYFQDVAEIRLSRIRSRGPENRISRRMAWCTRKFGPRRIRERPKAGRLSNRRQEKKMYDFNRKTLFIQEKRGSDAWLAVNKDVPQLACYLVSKENTFLVTSSCYLYHFIEPFIFDFFKIFQANVIANIYLFLAISSKIRFNKSN